MVLIRHRLEWCNLRMSILGIRAYINTWKPCRTIWVARRRRISYDRGYLMILWYDLIGHIVCVASPAWNTRCHLCCGTYSESLLFFYWSRRKNERGIRESVQHSNRFKILKHSSSSILPWMDVHLIRLVSIWPDPDYMKAKYHWLPGEVSYRDSLWSIESATVEIEWAQRNWQRLSPLLGKIARTAEKWKFNKKKLNESELFEPIC